jgi:tetratricopeptide (TPR) repeat protein
VDAGLKAVANDPKSPIAHSALGFALLAVGEHEAAVSRHAEGRSLSNDSKVYVGFWGYACGRARRRAEAESALNDLLSRRDYVPSYFVGLIHLSLGRHDDAIKWLDRAREEHSHWVLFLQADPMFDDLRGYSAFERLLAKIGFHQTDAAVAGGRSQSTGSSV